MTARARTVVIGLGNDARGDDAAGLHVARLLRATLPAGFPVVESMGDPMDLVTAWSGARLAVVIDAACSGAAPGTVHEAIDPRLTRSWRSSSHSLGLADAIALGTALDRLPGELLVVAIECADFAPEAPVTPAVQQAIHETARTLARRLRPGSSHAGTQRRPDPA